MTRALRRQLRLLNLCMCLPNVDLRFTVSAMTQLVIDLTDEEQRRLAEIAAPLGIAIQDLAKAALADLLAQPDTQANRSIDYLLKKNEDLYRRLA